MTSRFFYASFIAAVLLALLPETGVSQINRNSTEAPAGRPTASTLVASDITKLKLAPGFLVGLNVLDDTDFAGSFRIDEQGDIELPLRMKLFLKQESKSRKSFGMMRF